MTRIAVRSLILGQLQVVAACVVISAWAPVAFAQHGGHGGGGGGHFSGGVGHLGGGTRVVAPRGFAPTPSRSIMSRGRTLPPRTFSVPSATRVQNFRFQRRPVFVLRPVRFGRRFNTFPFAWGWGFNSFWWPCNPFWSFGFNCNRWFFYGSSIGTIQPFFSSDIQSTPQIFPSSAYSYATDGDRELPQLYLKDGTVLNVADYWLVDGQIHFTMVEERGTRPVEHAIELDDLDLQRTIDVSAQRGFRFILRNEPAEQYLEDHPDIGPPVNPPPQDN
jgi:hypothetical protein